MTAVPTSLYVLPVSRYIDPEYIPVIKDVVRMVCIQLTIQVMLYLDESVKVFFTMEFLLILLYVVLGVLLYWLVFQKIVDFK